MNFYQQEDVDSSGDGARNDVEDLIDLKSILLTILRGRWIIVASVIAAIVIGGVYLLFTPSSYTATARLLIDPRQVDPLAVIATEQRNYSDVLVVDSQIEVLRARRLVVRAMNALGLFNAPVAEAKPSILGGLKDWLLGGFGDEATTGEEATNAEDSAASTSPGDAGATTPGTPAGIDPTDLTPEELSALSTTEVVDALLATTDPVRDRQIDNFSEAVQVLRVNQTYAIAVSFVGDDPAFAAKAANAMAAAYLDDQLEAQYESGQRTRIWVDKQLESQRARLFDAEKVLEDYRSAPDQSLIRLRELERQAVSARDAYQTLLDGSNLLAQRESLPRTEARVIEGARIPNEPSAPKRGLLLGFSAVAGGIVALVIIILRQLLDDRIWTQRTLERLVGRRSLGVVPDMTIPKVVKPKESLRQKLGRKADTSERQINPRVLEPYLKMLSDPYASQIEVMRSANLALAGAGRDSSLLPAPGKPARGKARVVSFVSCRPGEGKTTLSTMFATYLARSNVKTLLIDADYRRPALTRRLLPSARAGIFDLHYAWNSLRTAATEGAVAPTPPEDDAPSLHDIIYSSPDGMFNMLPGRIHHPRTDMMIEEVLPTLLTGLLSALADDYAVIVIDFPPMLALPDAAALANSLDAMFLVAEWGATERSTVRMTLDLARPVMDKLAGCVLNKAKIDKLEGFGTNESLRVSYYG
jgi:uncharacterized protein involved in exopolysaccharide biosynthesis/Mrp family chromosome partitioning ATPase